MNWPVTFAGLFLLGIGIINFYFPEAVVTWEKAVGRDPSTEAENKRFGSVLIVGGIFLVAFFNVLEILK